MFCQTKPIHKCSSPDHVVIAMYKLYAHHGMVYRRVVVVGVWKIGKFVWASPAEGAASIVVVSTIVV